MKRSPSRTAGRGFTLLECMVSLVVLLVGIIAMMRLQVYGLYSDHDARARIRAQELAREMATALLRLDPSDPLLGPHYTGAVPATFGNPLDAATATKWTTYTTQTLPGVTPTSSLGIDSQDTSLPMFVRKWSVWQLDTANSASAVKLAAVSVLYHEAVFGGWRVATLYVQTSNPGAAAVNAAAYR